MSSTGLSSAIEAQAVRQNWGWFFTAGIMLVLLGLLALGSTLVASVTTAWFLGVLLLVGCIAQIVAASRAGEVGPASLHILLSLLFLVGGLFLVTHPFAGAVGLAWLMAWFFAVSGVFRILFALGGQGRGWGWSVASGALAVLLAVLLWVQWPWSGLYAIGFFLAVDLIVTGVMLAAMALAAHRSPEVPIVEMPERETDAYAM